MTRACCREENAPNSAAVNAVVRLTSAELMDGSASGHGDALATLIGAIRGQAAIGIRVPEGTGGAMPMAAAPMARAAKTAVVFFTSGSNVVVFGCANRRSAACARYAHCTPNSARPRTNAQHGAGPPVTDGQVSSS